ncbi:MAG TPA: glycine cleavage system aminomethyltransferase GcvT, partial [Pseudonocardiaceae bacterium]|nr:glycine cleavage system aminomethyltransferase GcvT [Pseudonocardiaceae bacterium]
MTDTPAIQGPLHAVHAANGARFSPFSGWEMPLNYADGGVVAEHTATRTAVGLFDVSHLGKTSVTGSGAADFVNACLSGDLGRIKPGQAQYTLCCTETGGVVDDLLAYFVRPDDVFLVPNAANNAEVAARLAAAAPAGVTVTDQHTDYAVLAVQGPESGTALEAVGLPTELDYMAFADADWRGHPVRVCRTGYTGEHGYELLPRWPDARELWDALLVAAEPLGGRAAGLGARDTLRTEMGYPLHGHELTADISPVQAGTSWAVGWQKDAFWGRDALTEEKAAGPTRRLRGLKALDAKFGPFGDWEMPLEYAGGGVVAEHTAVRESVGVFDVSHLGKALITGPGAAEFANSRFTNDLRRIGAGQAQYTMLCTEDGGVVDDLICYLVGDDEVFIVPNAANNAEIVARLTEGAPAGISITNQHRDFGVLAVQGPRSADVLAEVGLPSELDYMAFADARWSDKPVRVCRTGYTGEHGYELLPRGADATRLWDALLTAAQSFGGRAAGLGARDTLRTEMGYPLHGHELSLSISPVQAGAGWAVGWKKDAFSGHDALATERADGPKRRLRALRAIDRGIPRPGMPVLDA